MTANSVAKLVTSDSTKAEEIEVFQKFANKIGDGSYLASLFTPKLIAWVSEQIKNDTCPDLFQFYIEQIQETDKAYVEITQLKNTGDRFQKEWDEKCEEFGKYKTTSEQQIAELISQRDRGSEYLGERLAEITALENEIQIYRWEVLKLKAELYDCYSKQKGSEE